MSEHRKWIPALLLFLVGLGLLLPRLGASGLWDPWEPRYAQAAREMSQRGDWIVPYYREHPRVVKPPLTYWLIGGSQAAFGVSETSARLPSALLAALCPALLCAALTLRGRRTEGLIAGAALLTSPQWVLLGRFATPDMPHASLLGAALAAAIAAPAIQSERARRWVQALGVVAVGLATLTEFPRGLALAAWGVLGWWAARRSLAGVAALLAVTGLYFVGQHTYSGPLNLVAFGLAGTLAIAALGFGGKLRAQALLIGLLLLAVVVAPWFVALFQNEPEEAAERLLTYKHPLNLGETPKRHTGPLRYVLLIVAVGGLPWTVPAAIGLVGAVARDESGPDRILAGAFVGALLFFTASEAKMGHFYGVLQPPLAGLAGIGAVRLLRRRTASSVAAVVVLGALAWIVAGEPARVLETATVKRTLFGFDLLQPLLLALGAWAVLAAVAIARRREGWFALAAVPALLFAFFLGQRVVPDLSPKKSLRDVFVSYEAHREGQEPIGAYGTSLDTGYYYSDNAIDRIRDSDELAEFLGTDGGAYLVLPKKRYRDLRKKNRLAGTHGVIDEEHPSHVLIRHD
ncbi:MAG: phospholipid carrier-dependent glycosyltransferase [bacterium]|nr:phospholipid carrier-dependent glycosyltransferase [bacterium]